MEKLKKMACFKALYCIIIIALIVLVINISFVNATAWTSSLNNNLTMYYDFNQENNLTELLYGLYNATWTSSENWDSGILSTCQAIEGSKFSDIVDNSQWEIEKNKDFTINFWTKWTIKTGNQWLLYASKPASNCGWIVGGGSTRDVMYFNYEQLGSTQIANVTNNDDWFMVTITYDESTTNLTTYVNGTFENETIIDLDIDNCAYDKRIGANEVGGTPFQGYIDELGKWNRVLPSSEVTQLYNDGVGITYRANDFVINSQTYNATAYETASEFFKINIYYNSSAWSSISSKLNYDGINYTGTQVGIGDNINFTRTLYVPRINSSTSQNNSFKWFFLLTNSTGIYTYNSSTNNQTIKPINISICYANPFLNFTTYDIESLLELNATFKSNWVLSLSTTTINVNSSYQDITETKHSWSFCVEPSLNNYQVSIELEFDAVGYAKNFYYISNLTISNVTSNISLYLLNDSLATLTVLNVRDQAQSPLENTYITVQKYDVGTDTYYTVAIAKTDHNGDDLIYLNWYETLYKFILMRGGETIYTTSPYKISETPQIFEITTETVFDFEKFDDFEYSLYFNEATNNFVLTFIKPSGDVESGCLRVIKRNQTDDYLICETCETSSSATVYCNIAGQGNGTFIASFYATGSLKWIDTIMEGIGTLNEIYDMIGSEDGTVMAIIFSGIILSLFLVSPALAVFGMIIGALGSIVMGFQPIDYFAFIGIVVIGGLIIWFLKK